jgi:hypothetical protein
MEFVSRKSHALVNDRWQRFKLVQVCTATFLNQLRHTVSHICVIVEPVQDPVNKDATLLVLKFFSQPTLYHINTCKRFPLFGLAQSRPHLHVILVGTEGEIRPSKIALVKLPNLAMFERSDDAVRYPAVVE